MANINNPAAALRGLIVYAIIVPLAIFVGYLAVNVAYYQDRQSIGTVGFLVAILIFPLLMRWHYPLMIFSGAFPATLFFLPGSPSFFITMVAVSLTISVVERILNRNRHFQSAPPVTWSLVALLGVVLITGKLTGGFGVRALGGDVYGGKKYIYLIVGILTYFAYAARAIPKKDANLYMTLYFAGGIFNAITDLYPFVPEPLRFIYYLIPPAEQMLATWGQGWELGVTRLAGISGAAGAVMLIMLAKYGIRDNFLTTKIWRPPLILFMFALVFLGGFRSAIIGMIMMVGFLFYLEKMYTTRLMPLLMLGGFMGAALVVPLSSHLPYTFQRALAFVPGLNISSAARLDADASTEWRLAMWSALLPQIPKYLLLGKGYAFSQQTFDEYMGQGATFTHTIDASQDPLALSSDFHSGPLSVIISFGIWGVLAWLAFWAAGFWVVWRNYRYGDPDLHHINIFIYASFVCKIFIFIFIFGGIVDDSTGFGTLLGLSVAMNHGVRRPQPLQRFQPKPATMAFPARPALQG